MRRTTVPSKPVIIAQKPGADGAEGLVAKVRCTYSTQNGIALPASQWIRAHRPSWHTLHSSVTVRRQAGLCGVPPGSRHSYRDGAVSATALARDEHQQGGGSRCTAGRAAMMHRDRPTPRRSTSLPRGPGRRVVTGVDAQVRSTILLDGRVPEQARDLSPGEIEVHYLWTTPPGLPDLEDETDPMLSISLEEDWFPPPGGVSAAILTYEPGFEVPMHQSDTLDHVFIISGRIELVLEAGSTILGPGECVIQRGTAHSFRVVGDEPCTFCGVSVGAARDQQGEATPAV